IYLSLIGREEGVLKDGTTFICSDRSDQPEPYTLSRALADSSNEFFANLVAKLGVSKVRSYLERWDYPDADIPSSAKPLDVAMGQVFSVSPRQQLRMLVRFQAHELPGISEKSFEAVERAMREKEFRSLQGKTGSDHNGSWFIGFTEGRLYVLRSDVPNSQGKDLKALLIEHLRDSAPPSPPAQDRDSLTRPQD
ncbi:MAG: hypothetical protein JO317_08780, partial [Verrucomicrobiae bacterium]|nr:hypothetical protein [Verrucomicrobiae bacterium]